MESMSLIVLPGEFVCKHMFHHLISQLCFCSFWASYVLAYPENWILLCSNFSLLHLQSHSEHHLPDTSNPQESRIEGTGVSSEIFQERERSARGAVHRIAL
jgi:hypothetical protein